VQMRARERLHARTDARADSGAITPGTAKSGTARSKTPKSSRLPGYMTPKSTGRGTSRKGANTSRSSAMTNRTSSPTGRYHPDVERRVDIKKVDLLGNIDYMAPHGAPDNDRRMKESSWLVSQAFIEGLRYYPNGRTAIDNADNEATYSGNTVNKATGSGVEHLEHDLRARLDIAQSDVTWREDQLPQEWVPEKRPSMVKHMAKVRERLKK